MIRSELCAITEMNPSTFNSHRRNGDLPFAVAKGVGWCDFSIHHAALLIAARALVATHGVTWHDAAKMLRASRNNINRDLSPWVHGVSVFVAKVGFAHTKSDEAPFFFPDSVVYQGILPDILEAAQREVRTYNERRAGPWEEIEILSVSSVNLTDCYRRASSAADRLNIDI